MSFDKIFDLTAGVYFNFSNIHGGCTAIIWHFSRREIGKFVVLLPRTHQLFSHYCFDLDQRAFHARPPPSTHTHTQCVGDSPSVGATDIRISEPATLGTASPLSREERPQAPASAWCISGWETTAGGKGGGVSGRGLRSDVRITA